MDDLLRVMAGGDFGQNHLDIVGANNQLARQVPDQPVGGHDFQPAASALLTAARNRIRAGLENVRDRFGVEEDDDNPFLTPVRENKRQKTISATGTRRRRNVPNRGKGGYLVKERYNKRRWRRLNNIVASV